MGDTASPAFDLTVVGGGPAGSSAAITAAELGQKVLVLERERFPRFHIGESLLPASNGLLEKLGVADQVREAGFVVKRGASFWMADGRAEHYIDFSQSREVDAPQTYQVRRDRFDSILLEQARKSGATVLEETAAKSVEISDDGVTLVYENATRGREEVRSKFLIDASGQSGFLAKRWGLRQGDRELKSVAIHCRYRGVQALSGDRAGDIRVVSLPEMGWVWLIPLSPDEMSVGVVVPRSRLSTTEALPGGAIDGTINSYPALAALFEDTEATSPIRREADFSYLPESYASSRWLLAGDAGSFLDPVFSTGVTLALKSGREAAEAVGRALANGRSREAILKRYSDEQFSTYRFFRRLVSAFYDPAFRDVMFQPSNRLGIVDAMTTALAGEWKPKLATRRRIDLLFGIVAIHRRFGIAEKIHTDAG